MAIAIWLLCTAGERGAVQAESAATLCCPVLLISCPPAGCLLGPLDPSPGSHGAPASLHHALLVPFSLSLPSDREPLGRGCCALSCQFLPQSGPQ